MNYEIDDIRRTDNNYFSTSLILSLFLVTDYCDAHILRIP